MAYQLHIERMGNPISENEWRHAIENTDGVRLALEDSRVINPSTGQQIQIGGSSLDVAVLFNDGNWEKVFRWGGGSGSFNYTEALDSPDHPVRQKAVALAASLDAAIFGDEGEEIDWS